MQDGLPCPLQSFRKLVKSFYKPGGYLDHYQNLITCPFYHPAPLHKISLQCGHNFLSNVCNRQINKLYRKHNLFSHGGFITICYCNKKSKQQTNQKLKFFGFFRDHEDRKYSMPLWKKQINKRITMIPTFPCMTTLTEPFRMMYHDVPSSP